MTILLKYDYIFVSTTKRNNMLELTPQEKAKLNYIRLYEEQIIFNLNKQNNQSFLNRLLSWLQK
jgi:hypothetical protein